MQSLWLHLKDEDFQALDLPDKFEDFTNKTEAKLRKLLEQVVTAADSSGYDGQVGDEGEGGDLYHGVAGGGLGL